MNQRPGRNDPCPCGSRKKYKKCCLGSGEADHTEVATWMDEEGMHVVGKGRRLSQEEQERMTKEYQRRIRKSPLWDRMVKEYGKEQAEEMLNDFQVKIR